MSVLPEYRSIDRLLLRDREIAVFWNFEVGHKNGYRPTVSETSSTTAKPGNFAAFRGRVDRSDLPVYSNILCDACFLSTHRQLGSGLGRGGVGEVALSGSALADSRMANRTQFEIGT
jgi:hypothetical protein